MDEMEKYRNRVERKTADRRKKNGRRASDETKDSTIKRGPFDLEFWLTLGLMVGVGLILYYFGIQKGA